MNILQLSPQFPYPPKDGGKLGIYNITKYLTERGNNIHFACFADNLNPKLIEEMKKVAYDVRVVNKNNQNKKWDMLKNIFSKIPYNISKYYSKEMINVIDDIISTSKIDIVHVDHLHMAHYGFYIKKKYSLPIILREHNVETTIMERFYKEQNNYLIKYYAYYQSKKLYKYEAEFTELYDNCMMITEDDEKRIISMNGNVKTSVIPAGVDNSYFKPRKIKKEPYSIVHVGSMDWLPNVKGILWFNSEILPKIRERYPETLFYIVGKNPPAEIKKLSSDNTIVTGFVDDIREIIAKSNVYVVPLRTGGGMRIKILDSLSIGSSIVSTSVGCEGIKVENGKNILIANVPEEFSNAVCNLFDKPDLCSKLAEEGINLINSYYKWDSIAKEIEELYKSAIQKQQKNSLSV